MRKPAAIGFYPGNEDDLKGMIDDIISSQKGVKPLPKSFGVIVPHAGYQFSGKTAIRTLLTAKTEKRKFMIFCPNHSGRGSGIAVSTENWMTPFGEVKNNLRISEELTRSEKFENDEIAHRYEHAIEVQLPILQTLYKTFSMVPICLQHEEFEELEKLAEIISKIEQIKDVFFIASSDFTHFGPMYGYVPVDDSIQKQLEWVRKTDQSLIDMICKLDAKKFYNEVIKNEYSVCGVMPITLFLLVIKKIGARQGMLVDYSTSYETQKSNSFVSYAGIVFE